MKPTSLFAWTLPLALGVTLSFAGDEPKPTEHVAPAAQAVDDPQARAIVAAAAKRQNAGEFARPGAVASFHVQFNRAAFERESRDQTGNVTRTEVWVDEKPGGLFVDWKRGAADDPAQDSVKTHYVIDGAPKTAALFGPRPPGWIDDGNKAVQLTGEQYQKDRDDLIAYRKIVRRLLDVAFLEKMLTDGSTWRLVTDDAKAPANTVSVRRIPPAGASEPIAVVLRFIRQVAKNDDGSPKLDAIVDAMLVSAVLLPNTADDPTLTYAFEYNEKFPAIFAAGESGAPEPVPMRFPFTVKVHEQNPGEKVSRPILQVWTKEVRLNTVTDDDFRRPAPR